MPSDVFIYSGRAETGGGSRGLSRHHAMAGLCLCIGLVGCRGEAPRSPAHGPAEVVGLEARLVGYEFTVDTAGRRYFAWKDDTIEVRTFPARGRAGSELIVSPDVSRISTPTGDSAWVQGRGAIWRWTSLRQPPPVGGDTAPSYYLKSNATDDGGGAMWMVVDRRVRSDMVQRYLVRATRDGDTTMSFLDSVPELRRRSTRAAAYPDTSGQLAVVVTSGQSYQSAATRLFSASSTGDRLVTTPLQVLPSSCGLPNHSTTRMLVWSRCSLADSTRRGILIARPSGQFAFGGREFVSRAPPRLHLSRDRLWVLDSGRVYRMRVNERADEIDSLALAESDCSWFEDLPVPGDPEGGSLCDFTGAIVAGPDEDHVYVRSQARYYIVHDHRGSLVARAMPERTLTLSSQPGNAVALLLGDSLARLADTTGRVTRSLTLPPGFARIDQALFSGSELWTVDEEDSGALIRRFRLDDSLVPAGLVRIDEAVMINVDVLSFAGRILVFGNGLWEIGSVTGANVRLRFNDGGELHGRSRRGDTVAYSPDSMAIASVVFQDGRMPPGSRVSFALRDHDGNVAVSAPDAPTRSSETRLMLGTSDSASVLGAELIPELTYASDERAIGVQWPAIVLGEARPYSRAGAVALVLLFLVISGLALARKDPSRTKAWLPVVSAVLTIALAPLLDRTSYADTELVMAGVLGTVGLGAVLVTVDPRVFRTLADSQPFSTMGGLLLVYAPRVRRRVFKRYLNGLRRRLQDKRFAANNEQYVQLPALIRTFEASGTRDARTGEVVPAPADVLAGALTKPSVDRRASVAVIGTGGRGKSALLRATLERMLDACEQDATAPIPILCEDIGTDVQSAMVRALGAERVPEAHFRQLLDLGAFVVVVDGVEAPSSEARDATYPLKAFTDGHGESTRFLVTTRSQRALCGMEPLTTLKGDASGLLQVEALPLRDTDSDTEGGPAADTLTVFVTGYSGRLDATLKEACRSERDGSFSPLLIRLALLVGGDMHASRDGSVVAALYNRTFEARLGSNEHPPAQLEAEAASLCLRTYWKTGSPVLAFGDLPPSAERTTIGALYQAGILVNADPPTAIARAEPAQLRFFHDSMQSYLTALGLFQSGQWDALAEAAGAPRFLLRQSPIGGSELFQMCTHVFVPTSQLLVTLRTTLDHWASMYWQHLSVHDVLLAIPAERRHEVHASGESAGALLRSAVAQFADAESRESMIALAHMMALLAPKCYPLHARQGSETALELMPAGS